MAKPPPRRRKPAAPKPVRRSRIGARADAPDSGKQVRLEASRALGIALRGLKSLRTLFIVDAATFFCALGLASLVTERFGMMPVIVTGALFLGAIIAAIYVVQHPVNACFGMAIAHTLTAAWFVKTLPGSYLTWIAVGVAIVVWFSVKMALSTQRMLADAPDLWIAHKFRGKDTGADVKWRERAHKKQQEQRQKMFLYVLLPAVVAVIALILMNRGGDEEESRYSYKPSPPRVEPTPTSAVEPEMDKFLKHWNGNNLRAVKGMVAEERREKVDPFLDKMVRRHKWDPLPKATGHRFERSRKSRITGWAVVDGYGAMGVRFDWKTKWVITKFRFQPDR